MTYSVIAVSEYDDHNQHDHCHSIMYWSDPHADGMIMGIGAHSHPRHSVSSVKCKLGYNGNVGVYYSAKLCTGVSEASEVLSEAEQPHDLAPSDTFMMRCE
jgi:hypothetical protein